MNQQDETPSPHEEEKGEQLTSNILLALGASVLSYNANENTLPNYVHREDLDRTIYGGHASGNVVWDRSIAPDGKISYSYNFSILTEQQQDHVKQDFERFGIKFEETVENGKNIVRINDPNSVEELSKEIAMTRKYSSFGRINPTAHYTDDDIHEHINRTVSVLGEVNSEEQAKIRNNYFEIMKKLPPEQQAIIIERGNEVIFGSEEDISKFHIEGLKQEIGAAAYFNPNNNAIYVPYNSPYFIEIHHHEEGHRTSKNVTTIKDGRPSDNPEWKAALIKEQERHSHNSREGILIKEVGIHTGVIQHVSGDYYKLSEKPEEALAQFTAIRNKIYAKLGGDIEGTNAFMQHVYPDLNQVYQDKIIPLLQQEALRLNPKLDLNGKRFPPHIASLETPWRDYNSYDELFESNAWEKNKLSAIFGENARVIDVTDNKYHYRNPDPRINDFITTINDGDKTYLVVRDFNHVEEYRAAKTSFATKLAGKEIKTLPNFEFIDVHEDDVAYTKSAYGSSPKGISLEGMSEAEKQALLNTMINHWNSFMKEKNINLTYPSISDNHLIIAETTPQALVDECQNFIKKIKPVHTTEPPSIKGKVAGAGIGVAISGLIAGVIGLFSSNDAEANIGKLEKAKDAAVDAMADAAPVAGSAKALSQGRTEEAAHRFNDWIGIGVLSVGDFSRYFSRLGSLMTGQESTVEAGNIEFAGQVISDAANGVADFMKYAARKGLIFSAEMEAELKQKIASAFTEEGKPIDPKHLAVLDQIFKDAHQINMKQAQTQASARPSPNLECSDVRKTDCTPSTTISIKAPQKTAGAGV